MPKDLQDDARSHAGGGLQSCAAVTGIMQTDHPETGGLCDAGE
jgi:hypothetical protein